MTLARVGVKFKVKGQGLYIVTDGRDSTFYCHVISSALARRGVRRDAVEASGSGGV